MIRLGSTRNANNENVLNRFRRLLDKVMLDASYRAEHVGCRADDLATFCVHSDGAEGSQFDLDRSLLVMPGQKLRSTVCIHLYMNLAHQHGGAISSILGS